MPPKVVNFQFPVGGINQGTPIIGNEPPQCLDARNVRSWDAFDFRNRGGQRTGITKFFDTAANSSRVQNITPIVEAVALVQEAGFGNKYANPSTTPSDRVTGIEINPVDDSLVAVREDRVRVYKWDNITGWGTQDDFGFVAPEADTNIRWHPNGDAVAFGDGDTLTVVPYTEAGGFGSATTFQSPNGIDHIMKVRWHPGGDVLFYVGDGGAGDDEIGAINYDAGTQTLGSAIEILTTSAPVGDDIETDSSGAHLFTSDFSDVSQIAARPFSKTTGFSAPADTVDMPDQLVNGMHFNATLGLLAIAKATPGVNSVAIGVVPFSGGSFGSLTSGPTGEPSYQDVRWSNDGNFILVGANEDGKELRAIPWSGTFGTPLDLELAGSGTTVTAYAVEWASSDEAVFVGFSLSPEMEAHEFQSAATNPSSRRVRVVSIQGGNVYRSNSPPTVLSLANSGSGAITTQRPVRTGTLLQKMFMVDGKASSYQYLDFADNTVKDWQSAMTAGSLPVGTDDSTQAAKLIAVYRSRIVIAGLIEEPQNWFMTRAGDAFDMDFSQTDPLAAVAGNNSDAGQLGDVLTALAPIQDDLMFMGGSNSLWVMSGDPAAGGRIDKVSENIGIVSADAWAFSPGAVFYFVGRNGLYRVTSPQSPPEPITQGRMDQFFLDIDYSKFEVQLVYDVRWQGVHVFLVPFNEETTAPVHVFWDERNDALWKDEYTTDIGPSAVTRYSQDDGAKTTVLLGGYDGNIRQFQDDAAADDGTEIDSWVLFPMMTNAGVIGDTRLNDLNVRLDADSSKVNASVAVGRTAEEALSNANNADYRFTRTLDPASRSFTIRQRVRGNSMLLKLQKPTSISGRWAYEAGQAIVSPLARSRR